MSDSYGGPNPAQRPYRHPAGRSCAIALTAPVALVVLLVKAARR